MAGRAGRVKPARERLLTEFTFYASKCLKIRTKSAKVTPFRLNKAQLFYVMDADAGLGDFELVFIPRFWQDEYRAEVP